jgi:hypothetical protein
MALLLMRDVISGADRIAAAQETPPPTIPLLLRAYPLPRERVYRAVSSRSELLAFSLYVTTQRLHIFKSLVLVSPLHMSAYYLPVCHSQTICVKA